MSPETVVEVGREALVTLLWVSAPMLGVGLVVGLTISILQAATSVNEMTLTFVPKIVAVLVTALLVLPWIMSQLSSFTISIFERVARLGGA